MRLAIFSDVHANLEALKAVISDIEQLNVEKVVFLGDAVGYGANPDKCVKLIDSLCEIKLLGNHDYVAMGLESPSSFNEMAKQSILWTQQQLKRKSIERLSEFEMEVSFLDYAFVHATPENPSEWGYMLMVEDATRNFNFFSQNYCFVGHSHLPAVFRRGNDGKVVLETKTQFEGDGESRYIINVGSVGQPRDGNRDACYLIAETDGNRFEYRRIPYDLKAAQKKMKKAELPEFLITRLAIGK
ncbi:MAG: metallophosphoesterase family protein [FCB group bacterium]|nr:metallophosphoesterase family protein [FCB group bacterium]